MVERGGGASLAHSFAGNQQEDRRVLRPCRGFLPCRGRACPERSRRDGDVGLPLAPLTTRYTVLVASASSRISKRLTRFRNKLPVIALSMQRQLENCISIVIP